MRNQNGFFGLTFFLAAIAVIMITSALAVKTIAPTPTPAAKQMQGLASPMVSASPEASASASASATPTASQAVSKESQSQWETFQSKKVQGLLFNPYTIKYPTDWTATVADASPSQLPKEELTLAKGSYQITILQQTDEGSFCIFSDLPVPSDITPSTGSYDFQKLDGHEIQSATGTLRRFINKQANAPKPDVTIWSVCERSIGNTGNTFGTIYQYGRIALQSPKDYDPAMMAEVDKILATISPVK